MQDIVNSSLAGVAVGGLFRLAPEVLQLLDRFYERKHEARMLQLEMEFAKHKVGHGMYTPTPGDAGELEAILAAHAQQNRVVAKLGGWIEKLSASVRPAIAYWLVALYTFMKVAFVQTWQNEDYMILSSIITFYYLNRTMSK